MSLLLSSPHRDLLITDLENELRQLQGEWAAATEYCAELHTEQQLIQEDISAALLEERLLTKRLNQILGEPQQPDPDFCGSNHLHEHDGDDEEAVGDAGGGGAQSRKNKKKKAAAAAAAEAEAEMKRPWRTLNVEERERAEHVVFFAPTRSSSSSGERADVIRTETGSAEITAAISHFILGASECLFVSDQAQQTDSMPAQQPSLRGVATFSSVRSAQEMNLSSVIASLTERLEQTNSVAVLLQRQKDALTARLHQGGAVSVALDAMLLYRQPMM